MNMLYPNLEASKITKPEPKPEPEQEPERFLRLVITAMLFVVIRAALASAF